VETGHRDLDALRARIDRLPPLRELVADERMSARRTLGQHFLFDLNLTDRIARAARIPGTPTDAPLLDETVVEIGPGPGGLTRSLLRAGARVVAIEKDHRAAAVLEPLVTAAQGRLSVTIADALTSDVAALVGDGVSICANLPYNVATPLLVGWLTARPWPPFWRVATVMVQKEVAARITARPGSDQYGRLGVLCGVRARATALFDVAPSAFVPPPKVWSTVVRLEPRPDAADVPVEALSAVTAAAFGQRRKMLRSSLKPLTPEPEALLAAAGIEPTERAERLSLEAFVALARIHADRRGPAAGA